MEENKRLPASIKKIIDNPLNKIFISVVTPWEMIIKIKAKKLKVPQNFSKTLTNGIFESLSIQITHVLGLRNLPFNHNHKDPFDRILVVQAQAEKLTLISSDPKIRQYDIPLIQA